MGKKYFLIKPRPPEHEYKVLVQVYEDDELIAQNSGRVLGPRFSDVTSLLDVKVRDIWTKIQQMAQVANREQEK